MLGAAAANAEIDYAGVGYLGGSVTIDVPREISSNMFKFWIVSVERELSNVYCSIYYANFGFDTAENEPCPALRVRS